MQLQTPPISKAKEPEEMKMEMEEEEDLQWKNGFSVWWRRLWKTTTEERGGGINEGLELGLLSSNLGRLGLAQ